MQEFSLNIKRLLEDFCVTDTNVRKIASKILTEFQVYGGNGREMPSLEVVVKLLVDKIDKT